ncbi:glycosyltransferase [uncultured Jannaschia sp.]|uniref:glycosyltransferase n=1 Tax=uncultured Jannaschia sp. TaxID=293347 RepID=UPI0026145D96|nr:glycosyltransferase [uncultured Jannaschia sp.]
MSVSSVLPVSSLSNVESFGIAPEVDLSVVAAVPDLEVAASVLAKYRPVLDGMGLRYEVLCMADASGETTVAALKALARDWPNLEVFARRPWTGEDGELGTAYKRARGRLVLTLPGRSEVAPEELEKLFAAIEDNDMVVCDRDVQPISAKRQSFLKKTFRLFFGHSVSDVFCRVRLSRRDVLEEVGGFGVRQHFIPVIAASRGFRVIEARVRHAEPEPQEDRFVFRPVGHMRALFDAMALFVVMKFLHRPLRFFGAIGVPVFLVGLLGTVALVLGRLFMDVSLADRPLLIFSVLAIVLGIQIIALGLIGEIIIFSNSRQLKQYRVSTIIRRDKYGSKVREVPQGEED